MDGSMEGSMETPKPKAPVCADCGDAVRGDPKRVFDYLRSIVRGKARTAVESKLVRYAAGSFLISVLIAAALLFSNFLPLNTVLSSAPLFLILDASVLVVLFSYFHMDCYRVNLSCANGMMVGMTIGMMSGFLIGAVIGATNGMFIGSVVGVLVGAVLGFVLGRYSGVMGALEGLMAGLMSGTMGAMLSVMMVNDHLMLFLGFLFGVCTLIVGGLSYMMFREAGPASSKDLRIGFAGFFLLSVVSSLSLALIMVFGPKNGLTFGVGL